MCSSDLNSVYKDLRGWLSFFFVVSDDRNRCSHQLGRWCFRQCQQNCPSRTCRIDDSASSSAFQGVTTIVLCQGQAYRGGDDAGRISHSLTSLIILSLCRVTMSQIQVSVFCMDENGHYSAFHWERVGDRGVKWASTRQNDRRVEMSKS